MFFNTAAWVINLNKMFKEWHKSAIKSVPYNEERQMWFFAMGKNNEHMFLSISLNREFKPEAKGVNWFVAFKCEDAHSAYSTLKEWCPQTEEEEMRQWLEKKESRGEELQAEVIEDKTLEEGIVFRREKNEKELKWN